MDNKDELVKRIVNAVEALNAKSGSRLPISKLPSNVEILDNMAKTLTEIKNTLLLINKNLVLFNNNYLHTSGGANSTKDKH